MKCIHSHFAHLTSRCTLDGEVDYSRLDGLLPPSPILQCWQLQLVMPHRCYWQIVAATPSLSWWYWTSTVHSSAWTRDCLGCWGRFKVWCTLKNYKIWIIGSLCDFLAHVQIPWLENLIESLQWWQDWHLFCLCVTIYGASEVQNKTILMGNWILSCHAPVDRPFFIFQKIILSSWAAPAVLHYGED